jgi:hypothetical protein
MVEMEEHAKTNRERRLEGLRRRMGMSGRTLLTVDPGRRPQVTKRMLKNAKQHSQAR